MNYTDEEVELINEAHEKRKRFLKAKEEGDRDSDEFRDAKADMSEHRSFWRGIREMVAPVAEDDPDAPDGTAGTQTVKATAPVNDTATEEQES